MIWHSPLIVARLLDPAAKLATARMLDAATASNSLGEMLGLGNVTAREIYATLGCSPTSPQAT